jgi:hypothetical protein
MVEILLQEMSIELKMEQSAGASEDSMIRVDVLSDAGGSGTPNGVEQTQSHQQHHLHQQEQQQQQNDNAKHGQQTVESGGDQQQVQQQQMQSQQQQMANGCYHPLELAQLAQVQCPPGLLQNASGSPGLGVISAVGQVHDKNNF